MPGRRNRSNPFYVFNLEEDERSHPVFCDEYGGRTILTCILCNEKVKFGAFSKKALELDAACISTGHYARLEYDEMAGRTLLKKGLDRKKTSPMSSFPERPAH
jgi:tRNA-specific 2-thiouridylase